MEYHPIKSCGQFIAVAATVFLATSATANTARFYDDGLRLSMSLEPLMETEHLYLADTSRFYDDGLTISTRVSSVSSQQEQGVRFEIGGTEFGEKGFPFQISPIPLE